MSEPITGLGVVASLSRIPDHCVPVKRTKDTHEEADLGKENILRRSSRFLVLEKKPCSSAYPRDVIVDIRIVSTKDAVPSDFTLIDKTLDSREKCFKGKYICVKFDQWRPNMVAVTDVAIFKSIEGLSGHITVGEISDQRYLVYIQSTLSPSASPKKKSAPERPNEPHRNPIVYSPMQGVPFKLTRNCRTGDFDDILSRYSVHPKSREAVEDERVFMDPTWNDFLNQLDPLLSKGDVSVVSKLTRKYYATSYKFQNSPRTSELLQSFIKRIRTWPLDVYSILLELKLIFSKNKRDPSETLPNSRSSSYNLRGLASVGVLEGNAIIHDEPPQPRKVSFITLSDAPPRRNDGRDDLAVVSGSRKRPHPENIPDRIPQVVSVNNRRSLAKVRENDGNVYYKLRFLERTMLHISQKIEQLEMAESDLDEKNSSYLRLDSLKRRYLRLWREFCRLRGAGYLAARLDHQTFYFNRSRFSELNQAVEHFIRKSRDMPDYPDIRTLVAKVANKESLPLSPNKIDQEAREIFTDVVRQLKKRREHEFQRDIFHLPGVDQTSVDDDPALRNAELRNRLKENKLVALSKLKSIMTNYCRLQEEQEKSAVDVNGTEDEQSTKVLPLEEELEGPLPISAADAKISCPILLSDEKPKEAKVPRSTTSSGSPPDAIVISDDDDEPEIVAVEYHPPRTKIGATFEEATLNQIAFPMQNGGTMLISTAHKRTMQVIPPSRWRN